MNIAPVMASPVFYGKLIAISRSSAIPAQPFALYQ